MKKIFEECDLLCLLGKTSLSAIEESIFYKALWVKALMYIIEFDLSGLLRPRDYRRFVRESAGVDEPGRLADMLAVMLPGFEYVVRCRINDVKRALFESHLAVMANRSCGLVYLKIRKLDDLIRKGEWDTAETLFSRYNIYSSLEDLLVEIDRLEVIKPLSVPVPEGQDESADSQMMNCQSRQDVFESEDNTKLSAKKSADDIAQAIFKPDKKGERSPAKETEDNNSQTRSDPACAEKIKKRKLPFFDILSAEVVAARLLNEALQANKAIIDALDFIAGYRAYPLAPAFSCFIDTAFHAYIPRVASILADALHRSDSQNTATQPNAEIEKRYRLCNVSQFKNTAGRNPEKTEMFNILARDIEKITPAIEDLDLLAILTGDEFDAFLDFVRRFKQKSFLFFGDFARVSGEASSRIDMIKSVLNIKDFSIRNIAVDELTILRVALVSAGFTIGKTGNPEQAWSVYRQQHKSQRIDDAFKSFISKTVFKQLCTKNPKRALSIYSFSWILSDLTTGRDYGNVGEPNACLMLERLTGLLDVKKELASIFAHATVTKLKSDAGLPVDNFNLGFLFLGNPGTGKTTVAFILALVLHELGILKSGHLVTASRATLVGRYIGETAQIVREVFLSALDGVLFIDEAYSLYTAELSMDSYGKEAINTLTLLMTEYRGRVTVIMAGYPQEMDYMLNSVNPGLRDRFPYKLNFEDYNVGELMEIFNGKLNSSGLRIRGDGLALIEQLISGIWQGKDKLFANGRVAENVLQLLVAAQEERLAQRKAGGQILKKRDLTEITREDCLTLFDNESLKPAGTKKSAIGFYLPAACNTENIRAVERNQNSGDETNA